eukprot:353362_1
MKEKTLLILFNQNRNRYISFRPRLISLEHVQHGIQVSIHNTKCRLSECVKSYVSGLEKNPLITKSISSGVISTSADFAAQTFEQRKSQKLPNQKTKSYDMRRSLACLIEGICITGPLMHFGYGYFEKLIPIQQQSGIGKTSNVAAIAHVLADSIILDSIFVATKISITGILEG